MTLNSDWKKRAQCHAHTIRECDIRDFVGPVSLRFLRVSILRRTATRDLPKAFLPFRRKLPPFLPQESLESNRGSVWKTRRNIALKSPYMEQPADFLLPEAESSNTTVHISRWTTTNAALICRDTTLGRSNDLMFPGFQFGGGTLFAVFFSS